MEAENASCIASSFTNCGWSVSQSIGWLLGSADRQAGAAGLGYVIFKT